MDILGICSIALDSISKVDHLPILDSFCTVLSTQKLHGGSGANVMVQSHKIGSNIGIITQVANDSDSDLILKNLDDLQIDRRGVYRNDSKFGKAPSCLIYVDPKGEKELVLDKPSSLTPMTLDQINVDLIEEADVVYLDFNPALPTPELAKIANKKGKKVVLNIQDNMDTIRDRGVEDDNILNSLQYLEVFAPSQEGIKGLSGQTDPEKQITFIRKYYKGLIILTLGTSGLIAVDESDKLYRLPAFEVEAVDTTGAGDSFIGSFMVAYLVRGMALEDSLEFSSASAALTCTKMGAQSSPIFDEVEKFLQINCLKINVEG